MNRSTLRSVAAVAVALVLALGLVPLAWADPTGASEVAAIWFVDWAAVANYVYYVYAAYQVYGGLEARRAAAAQAEAARGQYNNSLSDRSVTALTADPPLRAVYGRCWTGGDVVAMLTSDKTAHRDDGTPYTKPDAYKHLVVVVAAREVAAINDVSIEGVSVGALDADGWATGGDFATSHAVYGEIAVAAGATYSAGGAMQVVSFGYLDTSGDTSGFQALAFTLSADGRTLTNTSGRAGTAVLRYAETVSRVRVSKFLGTVDQQADPWLLAHVGDKWTAADRLRGLAGVVVTLDLEDSAFQSGPPKILVDVSGHKLFDPRTGSTAWSCNPALVARDYLCSEIGFGCSAQDIDDAYTITAANACDAQSMIDGAMAATYTCHGTVSSDAGREAVLNDMADAMAGQIVNGAKWMIMAGAWTAPVMDLGDDDLMGQIEVKQAGAGIDEVFNGMRAKFIPAGSAVQSDAQYQNASFVAADGAALWSDAQLPFTNSAARARNVLRVLTHRNRLGEVLTVPCKLKAWPLQMGDRVRLTSSEYGRQAGTYRVTDWQFGLRSAVVLTLQADAPESYGLADVVAGMTGPASTLRSPWVVGKVTGLVARSGTEQLLRLADGTVIARVRLSWAAPDDAYVASGGRILVRWRRPGVDAPNVWQSTAVTGTDVGAWIDGVADGDRLMIQVSAVNSFGIEGSAELLPHTVIGKEAPPSDVERLTWSTEEFGVRMNWPVVPDADVMVYELRVGASWDAGSVLATQVVPGWLWRVQASGPRTVWVKAVDSTGHYSAHAASVVVDVPSPAGPACSYALQGDSESISWRAPASAYAIDHYELRTGAVFASAAVVETLKATAWRRRVDYVGARRYWVAAVDAAGNVGAATALDVVIEAPGAVQSGRAETVDNNVLLFWAAPASGSLPVERYEVRKGSSWLAGAVVGSNGNSTFTSLFEQAAGLYRYWVAAYDSAGNVGPATAIVATVNQPPDYVLRTSIDSTLSGARTALAVDGSSLVGPVDVSETWAQHFSTHGWASPADQVAAGFPMYAQPGLASASYTEDFDFGAVLPATVVTATLGTEAVYGVVAVSCQISYKVAAGDAWTAAAGGLSQVLCPSFRFVRVVFTLSCTAGVNLLRIRSFNLRLSNKLRTDSGAAYANAGDSGGTAVAFTIPFIDADTPQVQANTASPVIASVDFTDVPYPTGFRVYLYDRATGARVSGLFSWTARGY